eukprot:TRINITY_DN1426_c0_g1_i2.p1 TRINITY_DN1426_c0_g1~~TRINITY_DN1426_c0_g1_i2.p1  ORF type:complete len:1126 (+),score=234.71 TRINITY_DN1426_c0_g1_i2:37-3414(+)
MDFLREGIVEGIAASVLSSFGAKLDGLPVKEFTGTGVTYKLTGNCKLTASGEIVGQQFSLVTTLSSLQEVGQWYTWNGSFNLLDTEIRITVPIPGTEKHDEVVVFVDTILCATADIDGTAVKTFKVGTTAISINQTIVAVASDLSPTSLSDVLTIGKISLQKIELPQILVILRILHPFIGTEALPCDISGVESFTISGFVGKVSVDFKKGCQLSISEEGITLKSMSAGRTTDKLVHISDLKVGVQDRTITASVCSLYLTEYKLGILIDWVSALIPGIKFQENVPMLPLDWKVDIGCLKTICHSQDTDFLELKFFPVSSRLGAVRIGSIEARMDDEIICRSKTDSGSCSTAAVQVKPIIQMISAVGVGGREILKAKRSFIVEITPFEITIDVSQLSFLIHLYTVRNKCSDAQALFAAILLVLQQHDERADCLDDSFDRKNGDDEEFKESQGYFSCLTNVGCGTLLPPSIMKSGNPVVKKKVSFIDQQEDLGDCLTQCSHFKLLPGTVIKLTSKVSVLPDGSVFKMHFSESGDPLTATVTIGKVVFKDVEKGKQRLSISNVSYVVDYQEGRPGASMSRLDVADISVDLTNIKSLTGSDDLQVTCNVDGDVRVTIPEMEALLPLRFLTQFYMDQKDTIMNSMEKEKPSKKDEGDEPENSVTTNINIKKGVKFLCTAPLMFTCESVEIAIENVSSDCSVVLNNAKFLVDEPISVSSITCSYQPSNSKLGVVVNSFAASETAVPTLLSLYEVMKLYLPSGESDPGDTSHNNNEGPSLVTYLVIEGCLVEIPGAVLDVNRLNLKIDPNKKLIHLKKYVDGYDMQVYAAVKDLVTAIKFLRKMSQRIQSELQTNVTSPPPSQTESTRWEVEGKSNGPCSLIFDVDDCFNNEDSVGVVRFTINGLSLQLNSKVLELTSRLTLAYDQTAVVGNQKKYLYEENLLTSETEEKLFDIPWKVESAYENGVLVTTMELIERENVLLVIPESCSWRLLMFVKNLVEAVTSADDSKPSQQVLSEVPVPGADPLAGMPKFRFEFPKPFSVTLSLINLRNEKFTLETNNKEYTISELCDLYVVVWDRLISFYGFAITVANLPLWLIGKLIGMSSPEVSASDIDIRSERKHLDVMSMPQPKRK